MKHWFIVTMIVGLVGAMLFAIVLPVQSVADFSLSKATGGDDAGEQHTITQDPNYGLFLPLILRNYPLVNIFGADVRDNLTKAQEAGLTWARGVGILWKDVEKTKGVYDWSAYAGLDPFLIEASQKHINVIMVIQHSPTWARKFQYACGPIKESELNAFADFMYEVVKKYSAPPYNVRYFQVWNEQDAPYGNIDHLGIGCWGVDDGRFHGGEYFGEMLQVVYPRMKQANPGAQVVTGAFLLDCDPRSSGPGYCPDQNLSKVWNFAEGVVKKGQFDILAFNGYAYYQAGKNPVWREKTREKWYAKGGAVDGKLDYVRSLMSKYGVNKPIMLTEAGIFYINSLYDEPTTPEYEQAKADYITWVYANTWAHGLQATIWYSLKHLSPKLLDANNNPRPAYYALQTMTGILGQADYKSREDNPGYTKFVYHLGNQEIWLLIPTGEIAGTNYNVVKPSNFVKLVDIYGNQMPDPGSVITFNRPTYVFRNR